MLKQASVQQIRSREVNRRRGYVVITMAFYPRGVRKEWRDEYLDYKAAEKEHGHEKAFAACRYEERFNLSPFALMELERLSAMSLEQDVYLVYQCKVGERCHREMLMRLARDSFGAKVDEIFNSYS